MCIHTKTEFVKFGKIQNEETEMSNFMTKMSDFKRNSLSNILAVKEFFSLQLSFVSH